MLLLLINVVYWLKLKNQFLFEWLLYLIQTISIPEGEKAQRVRLQLLPEVLRGVEPVDDPPEDSQRPQPVRMSGLH